MEFERKDNVTCLEFLQEVATLLLFISDTNQKLAFLAYGGGVFSVYVRCFENCSVFYLSALIPQNCSALIKMNSVFDVACWYNCMRSLSIYRGYLLFLVKDRNLFHRVDTIGNIFTSGAAMSENITDGVHEMKLISIFHRKKQIFYLFHAFNPF